MLDSGPTVPITFELFRELILLMSHNITINLLTRMMVGVVLVTLSHLRTVDAATESISFSFFSKPAGDLVILTVPTPQTLYTHRDFGAAKHLGTLQYKCSEQA